MSLNGTALKQTPLQRMLEYKTSKNYSALRKTIAACADEAIAPEIYNIVCQPPMIIPVCLHALLTNPHLNSFLEPKALMEIVITVDGKLQNTGLAPNVRKAYQSIMVAIASKASWCRMLSYRYFLDFTKHCPELLEHIVYDTDFITHLDYFHVGILLTSMPNQYLADVLDYFDELLQGKSDRFHWAVHVLKFTFIYNPDVQKLIIENDRYEYTRQVLIKEANENRQFALLVSKNIHLWPALFGVKSNQAFLHPLLTRNDLDELIKHFSKSSHPHLALSYLEARLSALKIEIRDVSNKVKSLKTTEDRKDDDLQVDIVMQITLKPEEGDDKPIPESSVEGSDPVNCRLK